MNLDPKNSFASNAAEAPLVLGSVFGHRMWRWNKEGFLESPIRGLQWVNADVMHAYCGAGASAGMVNDEFWVEVLKTFLPAGSQLDTYDTHVTYGDGYKNGYEIASYFVHWYFSSRTSTAMKQFKNNNPGLKIDKARETPDGGMRVAGVIRVPSAEVTKRSIECGAKKHTFQPSCQCGFYAYFGRERNEYIHPGYAEVSGIIEGTGETLVGTLGFRSSKARIVALAPVSGFVGDDYWFRRGYRTVPNQQKQYNVPATVEVLRQAYPGVKVFESEDDMFAQIKLSSVLDFT